jgi:hypothetical protein
MSLRAFHIVFITLSVFLAAGCAWWAFANEAAPAFGIVSAAVAVGLVIYEILFLRKTRNLIL